MKIFESLIKNLKISLFLLSILLLTGCKVPQDVAYFQDVNEEVITLPSTGEIKIKPNDKLSIIVKTMNPELSEMFNLSIVADRTGEGAGPSGLSRYTVSPEGTIDMPLLGKIKVEGMTKSELAGFIKGELMGKDLAKDPIVTVELSNMAISVLGEVKNPGRFNIEQDKMSILDAISMAGDLALQGKRENITVLRETDGTVKTYKVDLTNYKELSQSPVYYLQQGDVVYVEPNDIIKRQTTTNGNNVYSTSFWISVASLLTSVVTTVGVFVVK